MHTPTEGTLSSTGPKKKKAQATTAELSLCKVEVSTWGTKQDGGSGMSHFLDVQAMGGNVGHASIAVSFPADATGIDLIRQYCYDKDGKAIIPYQLKKVPNSDKQVFCVYFSWWPHETKQFSLSDNLNADRVQERPGVNYGFVPERFRNPENPEMGINLEHRVHRGIIGGRRMALSPKEIRADTQSLTEQEHALLAALSQCRKWQDKIDAIDVIIKKLESKKSIIVSSNLLKLISSHGLGSSVELSSLKRFDTETVQLILTKAQAKKEEYLQAYKTAETERDQLAAKFQSEIDQKLRREIAELDQTLALKGEQISDRKRGEMPSHPDFQGFSYQAWVQHDLDECDKEFRELSDFLGFIRVYSKYASADSNHLAIIMKAINEGILPDHEKIAKMDESIQTSIDELETLKQELEILQLEPQNEDRLEALRITIATKENDIQNEKKQRDTQLEEINLRATNIQKVIHQYAQGREITPAVLKEINDHVSKDKIQLRQQLLALQALRTMLTPEALFERGGLERFDSTGLSPDNQITLPISAITDTSETTRGGMNIERMLRQMHALTQDKVGFDLQTKNCSVTTASILAAGAEPDLKYHFERRAWGAFGTPQIVLNGAMGYEHDVVKKRRKNFSEKISKYDPTKFIEKIGGVLTRNIMAPDISTGGKILSGVGLIPVGAGIGVIQVGKAALDPHRTFMRSVRFIRYARRQDSFLMRVLIAPAAVVTATTALPAAFQWAESKLIKTMIQTAFDKRKTKYIQKHDPMQQSSEQSEMPEAIKSKLKPVQHLENGTAAEKREHVKSTIENILKASTDGIPELTQRAMDDLKAQSPAEEQENRALFSEIQKRLSAAQKLSSPRTPTKTTSTSETHRNQVIAENKKLFKTDGFDLKAARKLYQKKLNYVNARIAPNEIKLVSWSEFKKHPFLHTNYARQLVEDVNHNHAPTDFKQFKKKHYQLKEKLAAIAVQEGEDWNVPKIQLPRLEQYQGSALTRQLLLPSQPTARKYHVEPTPTSQSTPKNHGKRRL